MTVRKSSSSKKNQVTKSSEKDAVAVQEETVEAPQEDQEDNHLDQDNQEDNHSEKLAVPTQQDTLATETAGSLKLVIEQARAIPQGLLENPTQASSSDLNIKDNVEASKDAVSAIQQEAPIIELKDSFLESLKEKNSSGRSSLAMSGIPAQWQSHREVKKCFEETPCSDLRGCIWT